MKYAICILAHGKPELLEKLVRRLQSGNTEIFIHLDAKCDIKEYGAISGATFIDKRVKVFWGGRSMVIAMYNLIDHVIQNSDCDYLLFISGQDYPVVAPDEYDKYIDIKTNYIDYEAVPNKKWFNDGIDRVIYFYPFKTSKTFISRGLLKLQKILNIKKNLESLTFKVYRGSQWININRDTARFIHDNWFKFYRFFRFCNVPDEMIFQTIILNSDMRHTVCNSSLRYVRYDNDEPHAAYVNTDILRSIKDKSILFCRKIKNEQVFDEFDRELGREKE